MNNIIFVKFDNHGSAKELGHNLSSCIPLSKVISSNELKKIVDSIKNSIIILVKYFHIENQIIEKLRNNNNKIFLIMVDHYPNKKVNHNFEGVIYSSEQQKKDFGEMYNKNKEYVYYHHYSPLYKQSENKHSKTIGYFTAPENVSKELKQINFIDIHVDFSKYYPIVDEYKFHIEFRKSDHINFLYKPCIKLSTASFCESIFICSKDKSYAELLPEDYPFFLEDSTNLKETISEYVNAIDSRHEYAIQIIKKLKERLNINQTSKRLLNFLYDQ
jgi:hypothetical protein